MTLPTAYFKVMTWSLLPLLLSCLCGCMLPLPYHRINEGQEMTMRSLSWLHKGQTTRSQVENKLGAPDIDFVDQRTVAYSWAGSIGQVVFIAPNGGFAEAIRARHALMIRFDTEDRVEKFSIISRPPESIPYDVHAISLDAEHDDWRVLIDRWRARQ